MHLKHLIKTGQLHIVIFKLVTLWSRVMTRRLRRQVVKQINYAKNLIREVHTQAVRESLSGPD